MQKSQLQKRTESFLWRLAMATLVFVVTFVGENAGLLELSTTATGIIALLAGEISKYLNRNAV